MTTREGRRAQAGRHASAGDGAAAADHAGEGPDSQMAGLSRRFPPRPAQDGGWPATSQRRGDVLARLFAPPFTAGRDKLQSSRRIGLTKLVHWLEEQPGRTWQDRWVTSGADAAGNLAWREMAASWLRSTGWASGNPRTDFIALGRGVLPLICGDVIRPSLPWLLTPAIPKNLAAEMARSRDPAGFAALAALARTDPASAATKDLAARRVAAILAAKGGAISGITVGDCLELLDVLASGGGNTSPYFYQLLHALGTFPPAAPPTVRAFKTPGQLTVGQLVDRYPIACQPVRALIIDYLRERQSAVDHATLRSLSRALAGLFWRDLELHHPGIGSLRLDPGMAAAWKQRVTVKTARTAGPDGQVTQTLVPRHDGMNTLAMVRAFYLDIAQWAAEDPARWGPWAVPCPIRDEEMSRKKERSHRKSRMDQRTRDRLPVLPVLVAAVSAARSKTAEILAAAQATAPGQQFTAAGQTLRRPVMTRHGSSAKVWAEDPATGRRRDLTLEEHRSFWTWAAVEVLRHTGCRIEEVLEISHHSLIQYRLPSTGEIVPLLQIIPSKTDEERLLVVSPELADVLSAIIQRIRQADGTVPLVPVYDRYECVWRPPSPVLFQRRFPSECRAISDSSLREMLDAALACTGLKDPATGQPLHYTPHDFRRIFITDAVMSGLPPHIAQVIAGHKDINTTMGYKAVYPEEAIQSHLAFLARRRARRPTDEYRVPSDEEWQEFLGHFERRKVATGICGRAFGTPCIHEHSCLRCSMHWPEPAQRPRVAEIRDNLLARIAEAEREGWPGEVEGLKVSLAGAEDKLTQIDRRTGRDGPVSLGATIPVGPQQEASTRHDH